MFNTLLYKPLLNALIFLYQTIAYQDLGVSIILLTFFIRLILMPLFYHSTKNQMIMQKLQPHLQKIQHDHKDNKEKQAQAMMELYKQHKVNPFSGIFLLLVQLPIFIALYRLFSKDFSSLNLNLLYSFVVKPAFLKASFLGLIDLKNSNILIVSLAAIFQYFQGWLTLPKLDKGRELSGAEKMGKQMIFIAPFLTIIILWKLPAAIGLYWLTTTVFSVVQQIHINKKVKMDISS